MEAAGSRTVPSHSRDFPSSPRAATLACIVLAGVASATVAAQVATEPAAPVQGGAQAPAAPVAPVRGVLGFEQALARALERGAPMLEAVAGREVAAAQLRQARAWENPTLSIEAENVLGRGGFSGFDAAETTVSLSQPLPLGGARGAAIRAARVGSDVAELEAQLAARELRRDVAIAYAEAIAADRLAAIERERARIAAQTRAAADRRLAAGLESELARAHIEVDTSGTQASARRALAEAAARRRALAALWREDTVLEPLDDAWFDAPASAASSAGATAAVPAAGGQAVHPRIARARLAEARATAELEGARAGRFGGVEATLGARRFAELPAGEDQAYLLGVSMPLPLWSRNGAAIAEARRALGSSQLEAERARRELEGERALVAAELEAATLELEALAGSGVPAATTAVRLAQQGYDAGRLSLADRLHAESSLTDQRERLERARLALRRAEAERDSLR